MKYNSWPLGKLPKELERTEIEDLKKDYKINDPRDVVALFEKKVASFAGSRYAVAVDCCSHGLFLSLMYLKSAGQMQLTPITIPSRTYCSVPMQIDMARLEYEFKDYDWSGLYQLGETRVWDSAVRWTKGMYVGNDALQVLSFQIKKRVPIGKGGIILTDDKEAYDWLKLASYDGRDLNTTYDDENHIRMFGYHYYMTPEDAARGILLIDNIADVNDDSGGSENYPDLSNMEIFK